MSRCELDVQSKTGADCNSCLWNTVPDNRPDVLAHQFTGEAEFAQCPSKTTSVVVTMGRRLLPGFLITIIMMLHVPASPHDLRSRCT